MLRLPVLNDGVRDVASSSNVSPATPVDVTIVWVLIVHQGGQQSVRG